MRTLNSVRIKRCSLSPREVRRAARNFKNRKATGPHSCEWRGIKVRLPKRKKSYTFSEIVSVGQHGVAR